MEVGTSKPEASFSGDARLEAGAAAAACTSEARISPPGPDPRSLETSTPNSFARRRALGEIFAFVAAATAGGAATIAPAGSLLLCEPARAPGAEAAGSVAGGLSPGATIQAMVCPTGMSAPANAVIPARIPSAGASTSTTALSVSISRSGSPLVTRSPSCLRQAMSLPVSCAISRAGITTLKAIMICGRAAKPSVGDSYALGLGAGFDHLDHAFAGRSFAFSYGGQRAIHREIVRAGNQKFLRRKPRDHFVPCRRHHDLFFDARRAPAIGGRPESFQSKHHAGFYLDRMLERYQAADHRLLPNGESDAVAILQRETGFFIGEAEFFSLRPDRGDLRRGAAGTHQFDRGIEIFAATFVSIHHRVRSIAHGEAAVIARAIAHVGMQNVVVDGVARPQHAIGKHMRMRIAAFARNRIHRFNIFRAEIVEHLTDEADRYVLAQARLHGAIKLVVSGVDHHGRSVEQRNFILRLDHAGFGHKLLPIHHFDALALQSEQHWQFDDVDADGFFVQPA